MEARPHVRSLIVPVRLAVDEARGALRHPAWSPRARSVYVVVALTVGTANVVANIVLGGPPNSQNLILMVGAVVLLSLIPQRPRMGILGYLAWWLVLVTSPGTYLSSMLFTNLGFYYFVGSLLPLWPTLSLYLVTLLTAGFAMALTGAGIEDVGLLLFMAIVGLLLILVGALLRATESARRQEGIIAQERLEALRLEIAREMHDLVAYSMSQTALRAQRAAADPSYSPAARQQFTELESTASDALHELRLLLRALRQSTPDQDQAIATATGLGLVVTDLAAAVRAVSEDVAAAGFDVTFRCLGSRRPSRLQASTLSRVAREMGANIIRHGDPRSPVTVTLALGPESIRLMTTNQVRPGGPRLPRSGSGLLGMRERLTAVEGTLTTLAEGGSWIATATIGLAPPRTTAGHKTGGTPTSTSEVTP